MDWIFGLLNVAPAVRAATGWARSLRGAEARVALIGAVIVDMILGWCTWFFDVEPTYMYAQTIHNGVMSTLTEGALVYGPFILILLTIAPTAMRQTLSGVASRLQILIGVIIILELFDARTDWPRVRDLFDTAAAWDFFSFAGQAQGVLWFIARGFLWFMATDGFEILFVAMTIATLILFVNSFRGASSAGAVTKKLSTP